MTTPTAASRAASPLSADVLAGPDEAARQEALQQIGQEFPAHYRDMIEQYFRKLATENEEPPK